MKLQKPLKHFKKPLSLFGRMVEKHCKAVSPVHYSQTNPSNTKERSLENG